MTTGNDFGVWVDKVSTWRDATSAVPLLVHDEIMKSKLEPGKAKAGPKSLMFDPLSIQFAMGYKDRRYSLTYDVLKRIPQQLSLIAAIIQTRCMQVASFASPYRMSKSLGFEIKHRNPARSTTKGEREFILSMENFIYKCGAKDPNPHSPVARDDFETFLKKIVRDSLMYDQSCFEVVPDRRGMPYEFMAVDASTIRLAANNIDLDYATAQRHAVTQSLGQWPQSVVPNAMMNNIKMPYRTLHVRNPEIEDIPSYIQIVNGVVRSTYTRQELAFGVRNPRTDIYVQGYGYSELEQLITIITAHLFAEEYNRRFFMQGSAPKGILNFKGENLTPDQLEAFKRQWTANLEGVSNSWRTPIMQSEQGVDWIDLHPSNQEMEYSMWIEYLIKITCAVFLIDPAELNFDMHGGVQQTPLFESSQEWKLKASRDRGLKPMLRFISKQINDQIVHKLDDNFTFEFVGLDELTEQEKHELRKEQLATYKTMNEIRRAEDLPDVPHGDVVMNPVYTAYVQQLGQREIQQKQLEAASGATAGAGGAAPGGQSPGGQSPGGDQGKPDDKGGPQYSDGFTKAIDNTKVLEISLEDDWMDSYRGGG